MSPCAWPPSPRGLLLKMRVEVHRDPKLAVSEQHRDFGELDTGGQQKRCRAMSQIVELHHWQVRLVE